MASSPINPDQGRRISTVWLAAGGTGGHIYPAVEVGRALREASPTTVLKYFCGSRPGERAIYRDHGIEPEVLPLSGRRPGLKNQAVFFRELRRSWSRCRALARHQQPHLAIGFGGYPSAPALWAARGTGASILIQEQNAFPGLANRLLARWAVRIYTGLPVSHPAFAPEKTMLTGNPVRQKLLGGGSRAEARKSLAISDEERLVLCFGGSLGAAALNGIILEVLRDRRSRQWRWLWSAGPDLFDKTKEELQKPELRPPGVRLEPYLSDMSAAYAAADLVICRAGALTLAELSALGKPSILVPLPKSAGDHQRFNARQFESEGASFVVEQDDPEATQKIVTWLEQFAGNCDKLKSLGEAARRLGQPDAARKIVSDILRFL